MIDVGTLRVGELTRDGRTVKFCMYPDGSGGYWYPMTRGFPARDLQDAILGAQRLLMKFG
jgi:hypothetical protein